MSDEEKSKLKRYRAKRASTDEIGRALSKYAVPKTPDTGSVQTDACGSEEKRNQKRSETVANGTTWTDNLNDAVKPKVTM